MSTFIPVVVIVALFALAIWLGWRDAKAKQRGRERSLSSAHAGVGQVSAVVPPTVEATDPAAVTPHPAAAGSSNELPSK